MAESTSDVIAKDGTNKLTSGNSVLDNVTTQLTSGNNVQSNQATEEYNDDSENKTAQVSSTGLVSGNYTESNNPLNLTCGGAILIEQNSGNVLYDYKMHEKLRPASVTKVMTLLLIMEALDSGKISLKDKVPCTEDAHKMGGSQIWLDTREELTVDEMIKAMCVVSANDCTVQFNNHVNN